MESISLSEERVTVTPKVSNDSLGDVGEIGILESLEEEGDEDEDEDDDDLVKPRESEVREPKSVIVGLFCLSLLPTIQFFGFSTSSVKSKRRISIAKKNDGFDKERFERDTLNNCSVFEDHRF